MHAPTEDESDNVMNSFYEELEHVFNQFLKYHLKILLGYFNVKGMKEGIFKPTNRNKSLHKICNNDRVRELNIATSRNLDVKSTMFPMVAVAAAAVAVAVAVVIVK
jgi:hypothetical protein